MPKRGGKKVVEEGSGSKAPSKKARASNDFEHRFIDKEHLEFFKNHYARCNIEHERGIAEEPHVAKYFREMLVKRGWACMFEVPDEKVNETVAREFFANLDKTELDKGFVTVRGIPVPFSAKIINEFYGFTPHLSRTYVDGIREKVADGVDWLEEVRLILCPDDKFKPGAQGQRVSLPFKPLDEHRKVFFRFINNRILPKHGSGRLGIDDLQLFYALEEEMPIDVGLELFRIVEGHLTLMTRFVAVPRLVATLCKNAGVLDEISDVKVDAPKPIRQLRTRGVAPPSIFGTRFAMTNEEARLLSQNDSIRSFLVNQQTAQNNLLSAMHHIYDSRRSDDPNLFAPNTMEYRFTNDIEARMAQIRLDAQAQEGDSGEE